MPNLKLIGRSADSNRIPTAGGPSLGDRVVFTDKLFDEQNNPIPGGQHSGFCTLVRKPDTYLCEAVFALQDGDIVARVLTKFSDPKFTAAITGGTRRYRHAGGEVEGTRNPQETLFTLEIHP